MILGWILILAVEARPPTEQLLGVKRVFVDRLTGGAPAELIRDLIITRLQSSQLFQITENEERADAVVRGSADQQVYTELHDNSEGITGRLSVGQSRGASSSTRMSDRGSASISEHESSRVQERHQEAIASVRLVLKNGDVVWSTTQESTGAKFRGASADVADKVARQLSADLDKLRRSRSPPESK